MTSVAVCGSFDDLRSRHVRFLEEASKFGQLHVLLLSDEVAAAVEGKTPKFPLAERRYFVEALRYVARVSVVSKAFDRQTLPLKSDARVVDGAGDTPERRRFCESNGLTYHVIPDEKLKIFPPLPLAKSISEPGRKKVLVTGCFDWVHSGHVRFFEEVSEMGDVYACIGQDANIELLKGKGHPMFPQEERRYMVEAVRFVKSAIVSTGMGWLDAEPEIGVIRPDIYAVNEDGDKPEKRDFCEKNGIEYVVLKREPKTGLTRRQSTALRGF
jgi:cytidyltransferase-like protein